MGSEIPGSVEVTELLLTAEIYNRFDSLTEDDLPSRIRKHYFDPEHRGVRRPIYVTISDVEKIYSIEDVRSIAKRLPFIDIEEFGSQLRLTVFDLGARWFAREGRERVRSNPVLAYYYENYDHLDVSYAEARRANKPRFADREWIEAKIKELQGAVQDPDEMLKLVQIRSPEDIRERIEDLVLTDEQRAEISKIEKAIEHRDYLRRVGLREIGKSLFVGSPGTGKTTTARAIAEWLGMPLIEVRLSMITSQYLGETSKNIDKVFDLAKRLSPCVLFVDEFDFVAKTRTSDEHGAIKRAVNTLLKAIDEISLVEDGVLFIAATNHPQLLDYAAWRRFDKVLDFPLPDEQMRRSILEKILSRMEAEVDIDEIASLTDGYSGSDLRLVVREAVLNALLEDRKILRHIDLLRAIEDFEHRIREHRGRVAL